MKRGLIVDSINPFPIIFKDKYDFKFDSFRWKADEYLKMAEDKIVDEKLNTPENGGVTTVVMEQQHPPHSWDEIKPFLEWMYPRVEEVWQTWNCKPMEKYLSDSWINIHSENAFTESHHHQGVTVAVAAYLQVPENSGRLLVENPLTSYKKGEPLDYYYWDKELNYQPIEVETNDVIFFPGWLTHKTEKSKSKENRYVMSLNIMGNWINDRSF